MESVKYKVKDENGIHARPAGVIVKKAKELSSEIKIRHGEKVADCTKLFALMQLGIKCGDEIEITAEGDNAKKDISEIIDTMERTGL